MDCMDIQSVKALSTDHHRHYKQLNSVTALNLLILHECTMKNSVGHAQPVAILMHNWTAAHSVSA